MCDRDILQLDVELPSTLQQIFTYPRGDLVARSAEWDWERTTQTTYHFTLGNQLRRVELRDNTLQYLISDGRQHTLVVVLAEVLVDFGEVLHVRSSEHTKRNRDHLQVLGTSGGRDVLFKYMSNM